MSHFHRHRKVTPLKLTWLTSPPLRARQGKFLRRDNKTKVSLRFSALVQTVWVPL
uniref:Uncharacterized protein n=1 Tax=Anguilla anguilla TaxID=7936 RepID=A0A0E9SSV0_ANGAN